MMKLRNRILIGLLILGAVLFAVMEFVVIPKIHADNEKYIAAQQEPVTHDLNSILKYKNKYMGNASNDINLFYDLPLSKAGMKFRLFSDKLELEVNYPDSVQNLGEEKVMRALLYNSTAAFALIDNLKTVDYNFSGASYRAERADIESLYADFAHILTGENWKSMQNRLNDRQYVQDAFSKAVKTKP